MEADEEAAGLVGAGVLLLPILIFQMEGFLVTGVGMVGEGTEAEADASTRDALDELLSKGLGKAYIDTGSKAFLGLLSEPDRDDVLDAMLISLARDCEASASVANVAS